MKEMYCQVIHLEKQNRVITKNLTLEGILVIKENGLEFKIFQEVFSLREENKEELEISTR